jgi:hypothetical protein
MNIIRIALERVSAVALFLFFAAAPIAGLAFMIALVSRIWALFHLPY